MNHESINVLQEKETSTSPMKAAAVTAPGQMELVDTTMPEPAADEVRFRILGCGLCASNLPPWEGREWFDYPMSPGSLGHEAWGIIDQVGEDVTGWEAGERVAAISYNAYAEYDLAKAENLVKIPQEIAHIPFPGEPLACAMNIFQRADIQSGMKVAIVGTGFLGSLLVQLAKSADAQVMAISRRQSSLDFAKKLGADVTLPMEDHYKIIEQVKEWTDGKFCERVIEVTGKQWPLDLAGELTAERGKLVVAGFHQDGPRQVNMQLWNWRGIDVINAHERDPAKYVSGLKEAVEAVKTEKLTPEVLFTHTFPKEEIQLAFELQQKKPEGFMKAIINFE